MRLWIVGLGVTSAWLKVEDLPNIEDANEEELVELSNFSGDFNEDMEEMVGNMTSTEARQILSEDADSSQVLSLFSSFEADSDKGANFKRVLALVNKKVDETKGNYRKGEKNFRRDTARYVVRTHRLDSRISQLSGSLEQSKSALLTLSSQKNLHRNNLRSALRDMTSTRRKRTNMRKGLVALRNQARKNVRTFHKALGYVGCKAFMQCDDGSYTVSDEKVHNMFMELSRDGKEMFVDAFGKAVGEEGRVELDDYESKIDEDMDNEDDVDDMEMQADEDEVNDESDQLLNQDEDDGADASENVSETASEADHDNEVTEDFSDEASDGEDATVLLQSDDETKADDAVDADSSEQAEDSTEAKDSAVSEDSAEAKDTAEAEDSTEAEDSAEAEDSTEAEDSDEAEESDEAEDSGEADSEESEDTSLLQSDDGDEADGDDDSLILAHDSSEIFPKKSPKKEAKTGKKGKKGGKGKKGKGKRRWLRRFQKKKGYKRMQRRARQYNRRLSCRPNDKMDCSLFTQQFSKLKAQLNLRALRLARATQRFDRQTTRMMNVKKNNVRTIRSLLRTAYNDMTKERNNIVSYNKSIRDARRIRAKFVQGYRKTSKAWVMVSKRLQRVICALGKVRIESGTLMGQTEPVKDCVVSGWKLRRACNKGCGGGIKRYTRRIIKKPDGLGLKCPRNLHLAVRCNTKRCPINCKMGRWSNYGACSVKCGAGGIRMRSRKILRLNRFGGLPCGSLTQVGSCNVKPCAKWRCGEDWKFGGRFDRRRNKWTLPTASTRRSRGLIRSIQVGGDCKNSVKCFTALKYCKYTGGSERDQRVGIRSTFGSKGTKISKCNSGYFLGGMWRTGRNNQDLQSISGLYCVKPKGFSNKYGYCNYYRLRKNKEDSEIKCTSRGTFIAGFVTKRSTKAKTTTLADLTHVLCCRPQS